MFLISAKGSLYLGNVEGLRFSEATSKPVSDEVLTEPPIGT
jgi:hypothetical protein